MKTIFPAIGLCLTLLLTAAQARTAAQQPISNFETTILLNPDGSAVVIEQIESAQALSDFERRIRISSAGPLMEYRFLVTVAEVTDTAGKPLAYDTRIADGQLRVRVRGSVAGGVKIIYGVRNAVRFLTGHDELYWMSAAAQQPVEQSSVQLMMPESVAGQFSAQAFLRPGGPGARPLPAAGGNGRKSPALARWSSDNRVPLRVSGARIDLSAPGPLAGGLGLVVNVFFNKGVLQPPNVLRRAGWFMRANPVVLFPLAAFLLMAALRWLKGRNADPGRSVAPIYAPPEGLTPAEVGLLVDDRLDPRDVTATLVNLAVRGYIRIEETNPPGGRFTESKDYIFRLLKPLFLRMPTPEAPGIPSPEWAKLAPHEQTMLLHTFYGGRWTKLSSLRLRFYDIVPRMRSLVISELKAKGMYRVDPEQAQWFRQLGVGLVAGLMLVAQRTGLVSVWQSPVLALAMIAISAVIVFAMGWNMAAKTLRGMRTYVAIRGFQEFMSTVESDRLERIQSDTFHKYLPYAMALGIEHRWASAFAGITTKPPDWYEFADPELFDSVLLGHRMDSLAQQTRATMSFRPRIKLPPARPREETAAGGTSL